MVDVSENMNYAIESVRTARIDLKLTEDFVLKGGETGTRVNLLRIL